MMSNIKTMFDLNQIDSQGGKVDSTIQHPEQAAINALEILIFSMAHSRA